MLDQHASHRHAAYGLDCSQYEQLLSRADRACEICDHRKFRLQIDHTPGDGMNGPVRGVLCPACNVGLRKVDSGHRPATTAQAAYLAREPMFPRHRKEVTVTTSETPPEMRPCPFKLPEGGERSRAHMLHSHAATLAYNLHDYDGHADPEDTDPTQLLRTAKFVRDLADEVLHDMAAHAREQGVTWQQMGDALGVTRQAAQLRFGKTS